MSVMTINGVDCVNIDEAANIIGVTAGRIRQLISRGELASVTMGARLKYIPLYAVYEYRDSPRKAGRPPIKGG